MAGVQCLSSLTSLTVKVFMHKSHPHTHTHTRARGTCFAGEWSASCRRVPEGFHPRITEPLWKHTHTHVLEIILTHTHTCSAVCSFSHTHSYTHTLVHTHSYTHTLS